MQDNNTDEIQSLAERLDELMTQQERHKEVMRETIVDLHMLSNKMQKIVNKPIYC